MRGATTSGTTGTTTTTSSVATTVGENRGDVLPRLADGTMVAEITSVGGLLVERRLIPDPAERWRDLADVPEILGLADVETRGGRSYRGES